MSGSGSAVYGIFTEKKIAEACAAEIAKRFKDVFVCNPCENGVVFE